MRLRLLVGLVLLLFFVVPVMSQESDTKIVPRYVQTYKIPVTYFDYHSDGSNPDFGRVVMDRWKLSHLPYGNVHGWADSVLTEDTLPKRSPALKDTFVDISWNLNKIFKPWVHGGLDTFVCKADSIKSTHDTIRYTDSVMISDTLYKNVVIADSLKASWVSNTFTSEDAADSMWVFGSFAKTNPLEGKGFGDEGLTDESGLPVNTGYTFSMHNRFNYHGGEKIYCGGDGDLYVYINGKLAIECAGFHNLLLDSLSLDTLGLTICWVYDIDVFFVERRNGGNFILAGFNPFENKGEDQIDTLYDTVSIVGVIPHSQKNMLKKGRLLGLRIPASSHNVKLEYFSLSGAKLGIRAISLAQALVDQSVNMPRGMNMVRVTFLNEQDKHLSKGFYHKMVVKK